MLVTLISKDAMHKTILPETPIGSYWIEDKTGKAERKLVNIESDSGNWKITTNKYVQIIDLNYITIQDNKIKVKNDLKRIKKEVILKENDIYGIYITSTKEFYILYVSPVYEKNLSHFEIKHTQEIRIGQGEHNHISYNNKLVSKSHARITLKEGRLFIENYDNNFGTFINSKPLNQNTQLLNGDVITIFGLKIIIMGQSIFINNPNKQVNIDSNHLIPCKEKQEMPMLNSIEEDEAELYTNKEYYSRAPRISNIIEEEEIKIDAPPQLQEKQEMPMVLMLGSTLSMGAMMMVSMMSTIDNGIRGNADTRQTTFSIVMSLIMIIGMILFPILSIKYEKKQKVKYEEKRQKRYKEYLNKKVLEINNIKNKQRGILFKNYVSAEECTNIILNRDARLWERKIEDYDFLAIRLGIGDAPLKIKVHYPEKQFAMVDDELIEDLTEIGNNSKVLNSAPIVTSLAEKNITAFVKQDEEKFDKFMQNIMLQLVTFQSYEDLKIVFLLDKDKQKKWEYVKMLPHIWESSHSIRFFADEYDDMKEISQYLEEVHKSRLQSNAESYKSYMPYYLIITDNYKKVENLSIIKQILRYKVNLGFSLLCITEDLTQLPNECKTFVNIDKKEGMIFENELSSTNQRKIALEVSNKFYFGKIWQTIANIPIRITATGNAALPQNYTFLEMYDVGKIEQLNILDRWKTHDSTISLKAPIGIDENRMPIVLDIHEKFHGPHGLIAGSTGSGKSEFIITYILSLAINYHPEDLNFVLIDYKGGGLAGAFQKNGIKLPHLVGTITNIDTNGLQRSLDSIHSEVTRRQVIFNEARNKTNEGTIDIYKYQKLYHDGIVEEPIPHLLIICDEFAELKQQQEEFMDELISISRIGRSLGVHLILATQKPAGIVNDQIRSNSKFAVCLKVQEMEDSLDVIRKPDAARLRNAGQFYMQVGNDDYFILGQSAWSGAHYFPADTTKKEIDYSIQFISNTGNVIKKVDDSKRKIIKNEGEQLSNIVKYICDIAKQENIEAKSLWLDDVPEVIYLNELKKKYNVKKKKNMVTAVIGEYDNPHNQKQDLVKIDFNNDGNVVVFGNAESGKETLLSTMVYDLITTYSTEEVQLYLLDFGSEALKIFKKAPQVGDVIVSTESEKIKRFFDMIQNIIAERKAILSDYNGDYKLYIEKGENIMPLIVIVINSYEGFCELYENDYDDILLSITREGLKYGIEFVINASTFNDIRYRMSQNFKNRIALQLNKEDDYYNIFEKVGKKRPSHIFGRGLLEINKDVFEFQTAKICGGEDYNLFINKTIENLNENTKLKASIVPTLPDKVNIDAIKDKIKNIKSVPIGLSTQNLKAVTYNFTQNFINIISSKKLQDAVEYTFNILEVIKQLQNIDIVIINSEKNMQEDSSDEEIIKSLATKEKSDNYTICVIIGVDKFLTKVNEYELKDNLQKIYQKGNCKFVIVENAVKLKNHSYDEWYKNFLSDDTGLWVGNGVDSQYLINITADRRKLNDNCGRDFGYVIKDGDYKMIKLLGMKKAGDEDNE